MRSFSYPSILRGARTVMSEHDAFDRVLAAVHAATLDETRWPATSALIDEACGLTGNGLMVAEGPTNDVRALFVGLYARGQRRDDLEREYLTTYHPLDERVPRFRQLPARRLVHITDLYTADELKTSRTYNELLPRAGMQDSLNVQLPGLAGSHIGWGLNDPVDAEGWGSSRITLPETTSCTASGAICTNDGRKLSHSTSDTVLGPVGISIADVEVEEGAGAVLAFSVALTRAASSQLTVDYATSDGTATAGADYTATSGTLTIGAGRSSQAPSRCPSSTTSTTRAARRSR